MSAIDRESIATYRPSSNEREIDAITEAALVCEICKRYSASGDVHHGKCAEMRDAIAALRRQTRPTL